MQINTFITTSGEWEVYVHTKQASISDFGNFYVSCLLKNSRGEIVRLIGSWHQDQEKAAAEHQRISMVIKSLFEPLNHTTVNAVQSIPKQCEHNWVMDGHNAGDPICSICYRRE